MKTALHSALRIGTVAALAAVGALICRSMIERYADVHDRVMLRVCLDDVARRVRGTAQNLRTVMAMNDASVIAKTRAFARLVAADRSLLEDNAKLRALAVSLDVDELHVSDSNGVLVACHPAVYVGADMHGSAQTRAFLPAIADKSFEFAQPPMEKGLSVDKGIDRLLFQYAGVARIDEPGIVQVGQRAGRVEEARKLADVDAIARDSHFDGGVAVTIARAPVLTEAERSTVEETDVGGGRFLRVQRDCEGWRITVRAPSSVTELARTDVLVVLAAVELALVVVLLLLGGVSRRRLADGVAAFGEFARGRLGRDGRKGFLRRSLENPVAYAAGSVLLIAVAVSWVISMRSARSYAEEVLLGAAKDMRDTIDNCVDNMLFYQGNAICSRFRTPEAVTEAACAEVMRQYSIDELNVVNARGIVIMGAIAERGFDMSSNPTTAKFNCLLEGEKTYSQPFRGAVENPGLRRKYAGVAFPPPAKGYVQIGFDEAKVKDRVDYFFKDVANAWHVGDGGFYVVGKEDTGEVESCGLTRTRADGTAEPCLVAGQTFQDVGFDAGAAPENPREFFEDELYGERCLCLTEVTKTGGRRVITAMPLAYVYSGISTTVGGVAVILLVAFVFAVLFMTRLSDLVASLKAEKAATAAAQKRELAAARMIQLSSLPVLAETGGDYRIYPEMHTAKEVGGDFYDFYALPDGRRFVLVADVSGKGISAAMFMMKAKALIKSATFSRPVLAEAVAEANSRLAENNEAEMFVTAWLAAVDVGTGEVEFVNAGHNPPLIRRADGSIEWVRTRTGLALAAMEGVRYRSEKLTLAPGDSLFLYTDGVTEAQDAWGKLYGEKRLERAMAASGGLFVQDVYRDLSEFVGGAEQSDDITMVAFDFKPEKKE